jgi:hypothetical protein
MYDPDVYPVNLSCWDGKVSEHWQHEEHPLEKTPPRSTAKRELHPVAPDDHRLEL